MKIKISYFLALFIVVLFENCKTNNDFYSVDINTIGDFSYEDNNYSKIEYKLSNANYQELFCKFNDGTLLFTENLNYAGNSIIKKVTDENKQIWTYNKGCVDDIIVNNNNEVVVLCELGFYVLSKDGKIIKKQENIFTKFQTYGKFFLSNFEDTIIISSSHYNNGLYIYVNKYKNCEILQAKTLNFDVDDYVLSNLTSVIYIDKYIYCLFDAKNETWIGDDNFDMLIKFDENYNMVWYKYLDFSPFYMGFTMKNEIMFFSNFEEQPKTKIFILDDEGEINDEKIINIKAPYKFSQTKNGSIFWVVTEDKIYKLNKEFEEVWNIENDQIIKNAISTQND